MAASTGFLVGLYVGKSVGWYVGSLDDVGSSVGITAIDPSSSDNGIDPPPSTSMGMEEAKYRCSIAGPEDSTAALSVVDDLCCTVPVRMRTGSAAWARSAHDTMARRATTMTFIIARVCVCVCVCVCV